MTTQSRVSSEANVQHGPKTSPDGHSATAGSEGVAPELKAKLQQMVETGKTRMTEWKGGLQDGIRQTPFQSLLIAAAVGAVIGVIVGRRG